MLKSEASETMQLYILHKRWGLVINQAAFVSEEFVSLLRSEEFVSLLRR